MAGYLVGIDFGKHYDYTAISFMLEAGEGLKQRGSARRSPLDRAAGGRSSKRSKPDRIGGASRPFQLVDLERYQAPYNRVINRTLEIMHDPRLVLEQVNEDGEVRRVPPRLFVDATGVGDGLVDELRNRHKLTFNGIWITAPGERVTNRGAYDYGVPKNILVYPLERAWEQDRVAVRRGIELWPTLRSELQTFHRKATKTGWDTYSHWRETDHDDLVLATAMCLWGAQHAGSFEVLIARETLGGGSPRPTGLDAPSRTLHIGSFHNRR